MKSFFKWLFATASVLIWMPLIVLGGVARFLATGFIAGWEGAEYLMDKFQANLNK